MILLCIGLVEFIPKYKQRNTLVILFTLCFRSSANYMAFSSPIPRNKDGKDLLQCPTPGCDGVGHVSGNYSTHRR